MALPKPLQYAWDLYDLWQWWQERQVPNAMPDVKPSGYILKKYNHQPSACPGGANAGTWWRSGTFTTTTTNGCDFLGNLGPYASYQAAVAASSGGVGDVELIQAWAHNGFTRGYAHYWYRKVSSVVKTNGPYLRPLFDPDVMPLPFPFPGVVPEALPVVAPSPVPRAPPFRYLPHIRPTDPLAGPYFRDVGPKPTGRPFGQRPGLGAIPRRPFEKPPGPGVKEKKFTGSPTGAIRAILGGVTEGVDAVYAMWDAMPVGITGGWRRPPPHVALGMMYRGMDQIGSEHVAQALQNLAANALEDRAYGALGRQVAKANRARGLAGGYTLGPAL